MQVHYIQLYLVNEFESMYNDYFHLFFPVETRKKYCLGYEDRSLLNKLLNTL